MTDMRGASENPLVSVVIPAYNAEEYVAAALRLRITTRSDPEPSSGVK